MEHELPFQRKAADIAKISQKTASNTLTPKGTGTLNLRQKKKIQKLKKETKKRKKEGKSEKIDINSYFLLSVQD